MKLRTYQQDLVNKILLSKDNALVQADTGAGKTAVLAAVASKYDFVLVVAHRNILIKQASYTLAKFDIKHNTICTKHTRRQCELEHRKLGLTKYLDNSSKYVCSIDSILSRQRRKLLDIDMKIKWTILVDEAHHMIEKNKWGKLLEILPNSRIIGFTATPCRGDNKSLARNKEGVFDCLIQSDELKENSVRKLISWNYLSDFKAYSIPHPNCFDDIKIGDDGEYIKRQLVGRMHKHAFQFIGDAVKEYKRLANNKQAIVFCVSIYFANETAKKFRESGISAASINSEMSTSEITRVFELFKNKQIQVITHVDMLGEGVDVPAIEAIIMLRKTASFGNYRQWIGRALRQEHNKQYAIIIDHVGNIIEHDMPDIHIDWSLEEVKKSKETNLIPCNNCGFIVRAWSIKCPGCDAEINLTEAKYKMPAIAKYLDFKLIEKERQRIIKEWRDENEIQLPAYHNYSRLYTAINKLQKWFSEKLIENNVRIKEINEFFKSQDVLNDNFWIKNFTMNDTLVDKSDKCLKVFKRWQKSKS